MTERIDEVIEICKNHNIDYEVSDDDKRILTIKLKRERNFTEVYLREGRNASEFSSDDFYKYKYVLGYEAIWSEEDDVVECQVDCARAFGFWERTLLKLINPEVQMSFTRNEIFSLEIPYEGKEKITISQSSNVFSCLFSFRNKTRFKLRRLQPTTMRIQGANVKTHADALKIIKGLMSTICFQLDCTAGIPLQLFAEQQDLSKKNNILSEENFKVPSFYFAYDVEALALFWNARSLFGLPLGQYLAFYQTIEFYFTVYSYRDAQQRIKNLLKEPNFDVSKDKEISKILNIVKFNNSSNSFGNEYEQLKATLKHCIDKNDFKQFIEGELLERDSFNNKNAKKIAKSAINIQYEDADVLFSEIAKRIYEIRCRIVHTKGVQDNVETLHPLSNEVRFISFDLKLIEFVAKKILISNSQPLS